MCGSCVCTYRYCKNKKKEDEPAKGEFEADEGY